MFETCHRCGVELQDSEREHEICADCLWWCMQYGITVGDEDFKFDWEKE